VSNEVTNVEIKEEKIHMCPFEKFKSDENIVKTCVNNQCEPEIENNHYIHTYESEEKTKNYSIQSNLMKECNTFKNEEKDNEYYIGCNTFKNEEVDNEYIKEVKEFNEPQLEIELLSNNKPPACSDYIPINLNSNLIVNNCNPVSPTHCEVPKDQTYDLDVSII